MARPPLRKPKYVADCERLMRCQNDYFVAGAVWRRKDGIWSCIRAAPIIKWMLGMSPESAKMNLAKRGCSWQWT